MPPKTVREPRTLTVLLWPVKLIEGPQFRRQQMCNSVEYEGRWYNTPAELTNLLGGADKLVWAEGAGHHAMNLCLCPVDLAATLANAGFTWSLGVDPMEWHVDKGGAG